MHEFCRALWLFPCFVVGAHHFEKFEFSKNDQLKNVSPVEPRQLGFSGHLNVMRSWGQMSKMKWVHYAAYELLELLADLILRVKYSDRGSFSRTTHILQHFKSCNILNISTQIPKISSCVLIYSEHRDLLDFLAVGTHVLQAFLQIRCTS